METHTAAVEGCGLRVAGCVLRVGVEGCVLRGGLVQRLAGEGQEADDGTRQVDGTHQLIDHLHQGRGLVDLVHLQRLLGSEHGHTSREGGEGQPDPGADIRVDIHEPTAQVHRGWRDGARWVHRGHRPADSNIDQGRDGRAVRARGDV